ncbi:ComEA family DNA-binding protein [Saccharothrix coeruleofusca]|uniref:Competence protein ComEA n=1 Tax=Saccharothrix coeruleofusca TaxID=33919 RepID=A0A918AII6_9PSEU|nr:ComEA family DNA-binding protein [Saccharothrix coeruleofusca]GGP42589.1 competence protein ComEA [Saccharothrix coeruleofusca]
MSDHQPEDPTARLKALMSQGERPSDDGPLVVFASAEGGADPPGRARPLLRRWLPARWLPASPVARRRLALLAGVGAGAVLAAVFALHQRGPAAEAPPPDLAVAEAAAVSKPPETVVVSVVGEVANPGLVTVPSGARVADAVRQAGGLKPGAPLHGLNLARKLADGEQVAVGVPAPTDETGPVNLNTATEQQLDDLPGVGPVTAQRIIDRRLKRGPFTSVEQLGEIEGIGGAKLARLAELVRV